MLIEFVKPRGPYAAGAKTDRVPPGVAAELVRRGIARPAAKPKPKPKGKP